MVSSVNRWVASSPISIEPFGFSALAKSIKLPKEQTQRDLQQSYLLRAALEVERLKALIEGIGKEGKR